MAAGTSTELLSMIQTSARNGTLLSSCAPEVKELMIQIDGLITDRQREWERAERAVQTQLQQRDREIAVLKVQVRERNAQVEHLRQESSSLEREYKTRYTDYESQLGQLRGEVARLSKAYSHLRARRGTRGKSAESEVKQLSVENSELKESVGLLQDTIQSKDELIRTLQEELTFSQSSAQAVSCESELCAAQERLRTQLTLDKALREELGRLKDNSRSLASGAVEHFVDRVESGGGDCVGGDSVRSEGVSKGLEGALEQILEKHFNSLDSSIQNLFETQHGNNT